MSQQLQTFSAYSERFLFVNLLDSQPKFKFKYALELLVTLVMSMRQIHFLTLGNTNIADHVKYGNFYVAIGHNVDLSGMPIITGAIQVVTIQLVNSYFMNDDRMTFVRQFTVGSFVRLSENSQSRLVKFIIFCHYATRAMVTAVHGYFTFITLTKYESSSTAKLQTVLFCCLVTYVASNTVTTSLLIATEIWLISSNLMQRLHFTLSVLSRETRPVVAKMLEMIDGNFAVISKLDHYWKLIIFVSVVTNCMIIAFVMVIFSNLPPIMVTVGYATLTGLALNVSMQIIFFAMVHSRANRLYKKLTEMYDEGDCKARLKINHVLKRFERLKLFTMFDVAPITYGLFREVRVQLVMAMTNCLTQFIEQVIATFILVLNLAITRSLTDGKIG